MNKKVSKAISMALAASTILSTAAPTFAAQFDRYTQSPIKNTYTDRQATMDPEAKKRLSAVPNTFLIELDNRLYPLDLADRLFREFDDEWVTEIKKVHPGIEIPGEKPEPGEEVKSVKLAPVANYGGTIDLYINGQQTRTTVAELKAKGYEVEFTAKKAVFSRPGVTATFLTSTTGEIGLKGNLVEPGTGQITKTYVDVVVKKGGKSVEYKNGLVDFKDKQQTVGIIDSFVVDVVTRGQGDLIKSIKVDGDVFDYRNCDGENLKIQVKGKTNDLLPGVRPDFITEQCICINDNPEVFRVTKVDAAGTDPAYFSIERNLDYQGADVDVKLTFVDQSSPDDSRELIIPTLATGRIVTSMEFADDKIENNRITASTNELIRTRVELKDQFGFPVTTSDIDDLRFEIENESGLSVVTESSLLVNKGNTEGTYDIEYLTSPSEGRGDVAFKFTTMGADDAIQNPRETNVLANVEHVVRNGVGEAVEWTIDKIRPLDIYRMAMEPDYGYDPIKDIVGTDAVNIVVRGKDADGLTTALVELTNTNTMKKQKAKFVSNSNEYKEDGKEVEFSFEVGDKFIARFDEDHADPECRLQGVGVGRTSLTVTKNVIGGAKEVVAVEDIEVTDSTPKILSTSKKFDKVIDRYGSYKLKDLIDIDIEDLGDYALDFEVDPYSANGILLHLIDGNGDRLKKLDGTEDFEIGKMEINSSNPELELELNVDGSNPQDAYVKLKQPTTGDINTVSGNIIISANNLIPRSGKYIYIDKNTIPFKITNDIDTDLIAKYDEEYTDGSTGIEFIGGLTQVSEAKRQKLLDEKLTTFELSKLSEEELKAKIEAVKKAKEKLFDAGKANGYKREGQNIINQSILFNSDDPIFADISVDGKDSAYVINRLMSKTFRGYSNDETKADKFVIDFSIGKAYLATDTGPGEGFMSYENLNVDGTGVPTGGGGPGKINSELTTPTEKDLEYTTGEIMQNSVKDKSLLKRIEENKKNYIVNPRTATDKQLKNALFLEDVDDSMKIEEINEGDFTVKEYETKLAQYTEFKEYLTTYTTVKFLREMILASGTFGAEDTNGDERVGFGVSGFDPNSNRGTEKAAEMIPGNLLSEPYDYTIGGPKYIAGTFVREADSAGKDGRTFASTKTIVNLDENKTLLANLENTPATKDGTERLIVALENFQKAVAPALMKANERFVNPSGIYGINNGNNLYGALVHSKATSLGLALENATTPALTATYDPKYKKDSDLAKYILKRDATTGIITSATVQPIINDLINEYYTNRKVIERLKDL